MASSSPSAGLAPLTPPPGVPIESGLAPHEQDLIDRMQRMAEAHRARGSLIRYDTMMQARRMVITWLYRLDCDLTQPGPLIFEVRA